MSAKVRLSRRAAKTLLEAMELTTTRQRGPGFYQAKLELMCALAQKRARRPRAEKDEES